MFNNYNDSYDYSNTQLRLDQQVECNKYVANVFGTMFLGLAVTAITALLIVAAAPLRNIFLNPVVMIVAIIAEFVLVFRLSAKINSLSYTTARNMFYVYAVLNGVTLSVIFLAYSPAAILSTFLVTAATFGIMSLYGLNTKKDLTSFGSLAMMGLIGLIILSVVNMILSFFMPVTMLTWIISILGLIIFVGLTAFDAQRIKNYYFSSLDSATASKLRVVGALSLYLDFINIFLFMLRIFGNRE